MKKSILSLLLLADMAASLLTAPAMAAQDPKRFTDLYDSNAVMSVESLRLMGVMDGYSNGTFRPDAQGVSRSVVASKVEAYQITVRSGSKYSVTADTPVYYQGVESKWSDVRSWLNPGSSLTLYMGAAGNVEYIFANGGDSSTEAVIVYEKGSDKGLSSLTGGVGGYTIYKNGSKAGSHDLRPYDVATYSSATNTIRVCDTRLTGYYESCTPSPTEPTSIRLLGNDFDVLTTAQATLARFRPGEQITLLLTEDNKVAGAVKPGTAGANAIGIAASISGISATIDLLCGVRIQGTVDLGVTASESQIAYAARLEDLAQMQHRLVRVTSVGKNLIGLVRLGGGVSGSLDLEKRRIGSNSLAETVSVFRYTASGLEVLSLDDLGAGPIPNGEISYAHLNWANRVDIIVLGGVNDGSVLYGRTSLTMDDNTESLQIKSQAKNDRIASRREGTTNRPSTTGGLMKKWCKAAVSRYAPAQWRAVPTVPAL